ncbi:MAG: hypothetical protein HN880_02390, partial [Proteobacteria bacterium]|nr:hypothetical protein [Pseudomonadota bacterium]
MRKQFNTIALAAALIMPTIVHAFGESDYMAWFKANQSAQPQFVDGDVITY